MFYVIAALIVLGLVGTLALLVKVSTQDGQPDHPPREGRANPAKVYTGPRRLP